MSVLVIEGNKGDVRVLREMFKDPLSNGATITHVMSMSDAEASLRKRSVDIILLDLGLPDAQGLEAVRRAHSAAPHVPVVVLTGLDDEPLAGQALQEGAQDYLIKGEIEIRGLLRALRYALERQSMEEALFAEKERAEVTLNCVGDAVACTDNAGDVTFLNDAAQALTGWTLAEVMGRPLRDILQVRVIPHEQDAAAPAPPAMEGLPVWVPESGLLRRRDGEEVPVENSISPIQDLHGRRTGAVVVFRDVTQARAQTLEMIHTAEHDYLTGLPHRMLLNDRITQAIGLASRYERRIAVLFLDLDGFKHINDSLGHTAGDKLLQSVAKALVGCVRSSDTVSRLGGDEFVVLLIDIDGEETAIGMAKRILAAVARPHPVGSTELHVTASIGLSVYPDDGLDAETLIKNADIAMYQAKDQGRQTYRFFTPEMNLRAVERHAIEDSLRTALDKDQFMLLYQPKIDLRTGVITGAEALIRWTPSGGTPLAPSQFIPVAEDSGLIIPIGRWVLREACRQTQAWVMSGLPMPGIAVNISAVEFGSEGFLDGVFGILAETGLDPAMLELELTESVLIKRVAATAEILHALRQRGVRVAVDDFGTGYSSLSYLRRFPVDALKIDQSFIRQISASGDDAALVTAVISMARSLNLRVVAEGVELTEELAFLLDHGCDEAQGHLISRAIPAGEFAGLLTFGLSLGAAPGAGQSEPRSMNG